VAVYLLAPSPKPSIAAQAPEPYFRAEARSAWAETKRVPVLNPVPDLTDRVDGPAWKVAGRREVSVGTPFARRTINEVVVGRAGEETTQVVCAATPGLRPVALSPDESRLVLSDGQESYLVDLSGLHAASPLLHGRVLAWRA
jgi:hypothetical protein